MKVLQRRICKLNNIPIVFSFDENFILPASIAIKSLLEHKSANTEYEIFVLYNGLDTKVKRKFEEIAKINWIDIDDNRFKDCPVSDIWNSLVYYRLLIPELLPQYNKIIYSDVDVLFKSDLSEVFNQNIDDYYWAGIIAEKNTPETICHEYFPENKNEFIYMTGFMLINCKKMREDNIIEKIFDNIKIFDKRLKFFDLDLLNITCNKITSVPFEYCVLENIYSDFLIQNAKEYAFLSKVYGDEELTKAKDNPKIIHYAGGNEKIWNRSTIEIPQYYLDYIKQSPFYDKNLFYKTIKGLCLKLLYLTFSKFSLNKNVRHKYRKKLNKFRY